MVAGYWVVRNDLVRQLQAAGIVAQVALPVEWSLQELRYLGYVVGVGKLADDAFAGRLDLPSQIILPSGIFAIGDRAFKGCTSVTVFTLPETVTLVSTQNIYVYVYNMYILYIICI